MMPDGTLARLPFWLTRQAPKGAAGRSVASPSLPLGRRAKDFLAVGAPPGQQAIEACAAARNMRSAGFDEQQAVDAIWRGLQACPLGDQGWPWTWQDAERIARRVWASPAPPLRPRSIAPSAPSHSLRSLPSGWFIT